MSYELCEKLRGLTPYDPIEPSEDLIRMDGNESFMPPTREMTDKIGEALARLSLNRYPDPAAKTLRERFAAYYGIDPRHTVAGNGLDEVLSVLFGAFFTRGQKILLLAPDFTMYAFYAHLCELRVVTLQKDENGFVSADEVIETARRERVDGIVFSNPCNPTSLGLCREEVRRVITSTDALVILDEAYMDFWDQSLIEEAPSYDHLILLRTCSKAMGLAGIRLGFAVAGEPIARALMAAKSPYNVNVLTQAAGEAALSFPEILHCRRDQIVASRDALFAEVKILSAKWPVRVADSKTNFLTIYCPKAAEIQRDLLARHIAVRQFETFLRVTAGTEKENAAFIMAFTAALKKYIF